MSGQTETEKHKFLNYTGSVPDPAGEGALFPMSEVFPCEPPPAQLTEIELGDEQDESE